jgi:hypothetical protein
MATASPGVLTFPSSSGNVRGPRRLKCLLLPLLQSPLILSLPFSHFPLLSPLFFRGDHKRAQSTGTAGPTVRGNDVAPDPGSSWLAAAEMKSSLRNDQNLRDTIQLQVLLHLARATKHACEYGSLFLPLPSHTICLDVVDSECCIYNGMFISLIMTIQQSVYTSIFM